MCITYGSVTVVFIGGIVYHHCLNFLFIIWFVFFSNIGNTVTDDTQQHIPSVNCFNIYVNAISEMYCQQLTSVVSRKLFKNRFA